MLHIVLQDTFSDMTMLDFVKIPILSDMVKLAR